MSNFIEELVAEFYLTKGYFVTTNYWIPFQTKRKRTQKGIRQEYEAQSWTDIDVLAKGKNELLIIQVKATINQKEVAENINQYYERVDQFLKDGNAPDGVTKIDWWTNNCNVKKIVVYEDKHSPPSYLKILTDNGIETKYFGDYLSEILTYIEMKKGTKEDSAVMRLLHFLKKQKILTTKIKEKQRNANIRSAASGLPGFGG